MHEDPSKRRPSAWRLEGRVARGRLSSPRLLLTPARARIALWFLLGLLVRSLDLAGDGLWMDEGYTAWTAHLPADEHRLALRNDDAPPLYYALQRLIVPHLPASEASVRALSVAAGTASMVWLVVAPPWKGMVEAPLAVFALGTYGAYYGRQARSYALLMLWGVILLTAVARVIQGQRRWLPVVALAQACAVWTHNVGVNMVAGANLAWLVCSRRDAHGWLAAQAAFLALWTPYLLWLFPQQLAIHRSLNLFITEIWKTVPIALAPILSLGVFTSGAQVSPLPHAERWWYWGAGSVPVAIAAHASALALLVAAFRRPTRGAALFAACMTLGPLVCLVILSVLTVPSYTLGRTDSVGYVGYVLWAGLGIVSLPRRGRAVALGIMALSTTLAVATRAPFFGHERDNDRTLAQSLRARLRPEDWVCFAGAARPSIDYYLSNGRPGIADRTIHRVQYPAIFSGNPASDYPVTGDSLRIWEAEARALRDRFQREARDGSTTFYAIAPMRPDRPRENPTASDLLYPGSMLAYMLSGLHPLRPIGIAKGDELRIFWVVFGVERDSLVDGLEPVIGLP